MSQERKLTGTISGWGGAYQTNPQSQDQISECLGGDFVKTFSEIFFSKSVPRPPDGFPFDLPHPI